MKGEERKRGREEGGEGKHDDDVWRDDPFLNTQYVVQKAAFLNVSLIQGYCFMSL